MIIEESFTTVLSKTLNLNIGGVPDIKLNIPDDVEVQVNPYEKYEDDELDDREGFFIQIFGKQAEIRNILDQLDRQEFDQSNITYDDEDDEDCMVDIDDIHDLGSLTVESSLFNDEFPNDELPPKSKIPIWDGFNNISSDDDYYILTGKGISLKIKKEDVKDYIFQKGIYLCHK